MKRRIAFGLLAAVTGVAGCGENLNNPPAGPSGPPTLSAFLLPQIEGLWGGTVTLTDIAAGTGPARDAGLLECAGQAFTAVIGESNDHALAIEREGTSVSARWTSAGTGLACSLSGRVGSNSGLVLDAATCDAPIVFLRCQPDPDGNVQVVGMELVGTSIFATLDAPVNVTAISGTAAHTYNLPGLGTVVANHSFTNLTRR